ncbi:hypothetical protein ABET23_17910 [Bacillus wiedmannii]|uniref:hypothetical protein n=1 Tax=Bacillus wiedmannii TaxID=1890302 RepID=UPI003D23E1DD
MKLMGKTLFGDVLGSDVSFFKDERTENFKVTPFEAFIQDNWEKNIKAISLVSQEELTNKSGIIGRAAVGGVLLGGVGALVGALTVDKKKSYTVTITYHDGGEDLAEVSQWVLRHLDGFVRENKNRTEMLPIINEKILSGETTVEKNKRKELERKQRNEQTKENHEEFPVVLGTIFFAIAFLIIVIAYMYF